MRSRYPAGVADAPFLTNHDQVRVATQLEGRPGPLATAASLLLTLPGSPFLYYGEELGLANGTTATTRPSARPCRGTGATGGGFTAGTPWFAFSPGHESDPRGRADGHSRLAAVALPRAHPRPSCLARPGARRD